MNPLTPRLLPASPWIALVLLLTLLPAALLGAGGKPLSERQVLGLLRGSVASQRVEQLVRTRGINFYPSNKILQEFRDAGARPALLSALEEADQTLSPQAQAFGSKRQDAANYVAQGQKLLERQLWSEAETKLRQAVQLDPADPGAHFYLAHALSEERKWDDAIAEYREAIILAPDSAAAHSNLGEALLAKGDPLDAATEYREALKLSPSDKTALYGLGVTLYDEGKWAKAASQFRAALRVEPAHEDVLCALGLALLQQNKTAAAIQQYKKALRLNPHSATAHAGLGYALLKKGERRQALEEYRTAASLAPSDFNLRASYQALWRQLNP